MADVPPYDLDVMLKSRGFGQGRLSNIGRRLICGRVANTTTGGAAEGTWEILIELATDFDSIAPMFVNGFTSGVASPAITQCIARPVPNTTKAASDAAPRSIMTVGGSGSGVLTAATAANRRKITRWDQVACSSVARDDSGTGRLVVIRAHIAAGTIVVTGNGVQSFSNWSTRPSRIYRLSFIAGATDYSSSANWASWNSAASVVSGGSPFAGAEYSSPNMVGNISVFGNSNDSGQGDDNAAINYIGEGYGVPAVELLTANTPTGIAWESSDLAWAGLSMPNIRRHIEDAITDGVQGDIAVWPDGEVNSASAPLVATDIDAATTTQAGVRNVRAQINYAFAGVASKTIPITHTWDPTATAAKAFGGPGDQLRRDYVATTRAARGRVVADFDAVMAGSPDGTGQVQPISAYLKPTDLIHYNRAGNAVKAQVLVNAVAFALSTPKNSVALS